MVSRDQAALSDEDFGLAIVRSVLVAFQRRLIPVRWGAAHRYEVADRGARFVVEGPRCKPLQIHTRDGWQSRERCQSWPCPHFGSTLLPHMYRGRADRGPDVPMQPFGDECQPAHMHYDCWFCWFGKTHTFGEHAVEVAFSQARQTLAGEDRTPWLGHLAEGDGAETEAAHREAAQLAISSLEGYR